jgi:hypothetical protein
MRKKGSAVEEKLDIIAEAERDSHGNKGMEGRGISPTLSCRGHTSNRKGSRKYGRNNVGREACMIQQGLVGTLPLSIIVRKQLANGSLIRRMR